MWLCRLSFLYRYRLTLSVPWVFIHVFFSAWYISIHSFFLVNLPHAFRCISGIIASIEQVEFKCASIIIITLNDNYLFRCRLSYKDGDMLFEDRSLILIFPWHLAWCLAKNGHSVVCSIERRSVEGRERKGEERKGREGWRWNKERWIKYNREGKRE